MGLGRRGGGVGGRSSERPVGLFILHPFFC